MFVAYPAGGETAGLHSGGVWHQPRPLAVASVPALVPAQRPVAPTWLSLRRTGSQTPCERSILCGRPCRPLAVDRLLRFRGTRHLCGAVFPTPTPLSLGAVSRRPVPPGRSRIASPVRPWRRGTAARGVRLPSRKKRIRERPPRRVPARAAAAGASRGPGSQNLGRNAIFSL